VGPREREGCEAAGGGDDVREAVDAVPGVRVGDAGDELGGADDRRGETREGHDAHANLTDSLVAERRERRRTTAPGRRLGPVCHGGHCPDCSETCEVVDHGPREAGAIVRENAARESSGAPRDVRERRRCGRGCARRSRRVRAGRGRGWISGRGVIQAADLGEGATCLLGPAQLGRTPVRVDHRDDLQRQERAGHQPPTIGAAMRFITSAPEPPAHRMGTRPTSIVRHGHQLGPHALDVPSMCAQTMSSRSR
jgi:hypothetical protein